MQDACWTQATQQATKRSALDPVMLAAGASVLLSWIVFYGKGDEEQGLTVALWRPTLLAFASYVQQTQLQVQLENQGVTDVVCRVQRAIEQQQQG